MPDESETWYVRGMRDVTSIKDAKSNAIGRAGDFTRDPGPIRVLPQAREVSASEERAWLHVTFCVSVNVWTLCDFANGESLC